MKNENVIKLLNQQSIHGNKAGQKISRSLLKSSLRQYQCIFRKELGHGFLYNGQMYIGSPATKFDQYFQGCFNHKGEPHFLKTGISATNTMHNIGTEAGWRIKATLIHECSATRLNDTAGLQNLCYERCLYALTSSSHVVQYLQPASGWMVEKSYYLGDITFTHMNYENQLERFVVKSKHYPHGRAKDVRLYFVLLETAPFAFKAVFPISESVFGKVKDAFVINGLIVTLSSDYYSFYSLDEMLNASMIHATNFGDRIPVSEALENLGYDTDSSVVGEYPYGVPVNVNVREKPELLFQIASKDVYGLSFGGFPWFCLGSQHDQSKLYRVKTGDQVNVLRHGKYSFAMLDDEKKAYFHSDRSGRILSIEYDEIRCLKLIEDNEGKIDFDTCYTIKYGQEFIQKQRPKQRRSKSGRVYKPIVSQDCTALPSEIIHALDYDNDLDILAVLHTHVTVDGRQSKYAVSLYDNSNGDVIRTFFLEVEHSDKDAHDWNIFVNDSLLICTLRIVGRSLNRNTVFVYSFVEQESL